MTDHARLLDAAIRAVADACRVCRRVQANMEQVRAIAKDDKSPVTVADFASQAVVAHALGARLGRPVLVAEETSEFLRQPHHAAHLAGALAAAREAWPKATEHDVLDAIDVGGSEPLHAGFWALDPIDGTKGFLRGGQYAVSLAFVERGEVVVGVLGCPALPRDFSLPLDRPDRRGCIYYAVRGDGLYEVPADDPFTNPVHIRRLDHAEDEPVTVCASVEESHTDPQVTARVLARVGRPRATVRLDSQAKYAVVARGQADAYLRITPRAGYQEWIWDHAAGSLVAAEGGCAVTDIAGRQLDFSRGRKLDLNRGIVCAPPRVHGLLLAAISGLGLTEA